MAVNLEVVDGERNFLDFNKAFFEKLEPPRGFTCPAAEAVAEAQVKDIREILFPHSADEAA